MKRMSDDMRERLARTIADSRDTVGPSEANWIARSIIDEGWHDGPRIPAEGTPEWDSAVERAAVAVFDERWGLLHGRETKPSGQDETTAAAVIRAFLGEPSE